MKNVQIEISDEQFESIAKILSTRKDRTQKEILLLIVERGIYALEYRTKYNKVKYARDKETREEFRQWKERKELVSALSSEARVVSSPKQ
jgi:hypothetical protein